MIQGQFSIAKIDDEIFEVGPIEGTQKQGKYQYYIESEERFVFAGFYENDQKIGFWIEILNIQKKKNVISCGKYTQGLKNGKWTIYYKQKIIAGGQYLDGKKTGPWIDVEELSPQIGYIEMTFCQGLYENGIKKGNWRIYTDSEKLYHDVGGFYDENGQKDGLWIEWLGYKKVYGKYKHGQPFGEWKYLNGKLQGLYDENGLKQGHWKDDDYQEGEYLDGKKTGYWATRSAKGYFKNGLKTGEWTERIKQIQCTGQYKKGKRIGEWKLEYDNQKGKGSYNTNGLKQGLWTELQQKGKFYEGYYKDDKRIGRWKSYIYNDQNIVSVGEYIDGLKQGEWIENNEKKIYKDGVLWIWKEDDEKKKPLLMTIKKRAITEIWTYFEIDFNDYSSKSRIGAWIQKSETGIEQDLQSGVYIIDENNDMYYLSGDFKDGYQIAKEINLMARGNETQNNDILEIWKDKNNLLLEKNDGSVIRLLNIENFKSEDFHKWVQGSIFLSGCQQQGFRQGKWILQFELKDKITCIGGGYYEKGLKNGYWIEPSKDYKIGYEQTYRGEYKDERRIGMWRLFYQNIEIGGGKYDEYGFKQGEWIEPVLDFSFGKQFTVQGTYKDGIRVGEWKVLFKRKKVGGGFYNEEGEKNGIWVEALLKKEQYKFSDLPMRTVNYLNGDMI